MAQITERFEGVPLDRIRDFAEKVEFQVEETEQGLDLQAHGEVHHLQIQSGRRSSRTGADVLGRIILSNQIDDGPPPSPSQHAFVAQVNRLTALTALLPSGTDGCSSVVSRLTYYDAGEAAWDRHIPLLVMAAITEHITTTHAILDIHGDLPADRPDPPNDSPVHSEEDFAAAGTLLRNHDVFTIEGEAGLTAQFPWEPEAEISVDQPGLTSLLTMTTEEAHPPLGTGTLCKLYLPRPVDPEEAPEVATYLNQQELAAEDAPPFFGAWSIQSDSDLVFVSFLPIQLCRFVEPAHLATWMKARSELVPHWIAAWTEAERQ